MPFSGNIQSAKGQNWIIKEPDEANVQELLRCGLSFIEARILAMRGIKPHEVEDFINPKLKNQMPNPSNLFDMDNAVCAIIDAIKANKAITIFADYDVDGGTSAAILTSWFEYVGANSNIFVPDRIKDGYGPTPELMREIKEKGCDLLISVDCGAAAYSALNTAKEIGLDVVVFDHHLMHGMPPPALAIVNPNQDCDTSALGDLTAAGVCFMAVVALNREWRKTQNAEGNFDALSLLDLVALGTICDVAPLTGLNRVFVAQGQKFLGMQKRIGLKILSQVAGLKKSGNVYAAAWVLGPRLNAGGRIGSSSLTVKLLTTNDENEALRLSEELEALNASRRAIEQSIIEEAVNMVENGEGREDIIILAKQGWHPGIIGIVAGRIKEKYSKPAIILGSVDERDAILKGSGRSINGVNLGALIKSMVDDGFLLSGGGHKMAAGLAVEIEKVKIIRDEMCARLPQFSNESEKNKFQNIDAIISSQSINFDLINSLSRLGPFGQGWNEPILAIKDAKIISYNIMNGGHLRLVFVDSSQITNSAICFNAMGTKVGEILLSKRPCCLIIKAKKNEWRGQNLVEAEIIDVISEFDT